MDATSLLVVVAHPDDETFGCGSVLMHAAAAGLRTGVVCATRGEAGELAPDVIAPDGIGVLREAELRSAADLLGVDHVQLLDFEDSGMSGDSSPHSVCGADLADLTAAVARAVEAFSPDIVVTLDGGDGHRDHVRIRAVVEAVLASTANIANTANPATSSTTLYLHALPRSLMHAWILHHSADEQAAEYVHLPEIGTPDGQVTTIVDTSAFLDRRRNAIAAHRSQRSPFDGLPTELERQFLAREHLIRLRPTWASGTTEDDLLGMPRLVHPASAAADDPTSTDTDTDTKGLQP